MSESTTFWNRHFNPSDSTSRIEADAQEHVALGLGGAVCIGTAIVGKAFFKGKTNTTLVLGGIGTGLLTSYFTQKDGYAYTVALVAGGKIIHKITDTVMNGKVDVSFHIDVADIIRALSEN